MQRKALNLLTALYITGCGAAEKAQDGAGAPSPPAATTQATRTQPEASAPAEEAMPVTLAVADQKALPICDASHEDELAYVRAEKTFYVCGGLTWTAIDLRGPQGAPGQDGVAGADGKAGDEGPAGKDGVTGASGKDGAKGEVVTAVPPSANEFYESASGLYWTKTTVNVTFDLAQLACDRPGWRLPTEIEFKRAYALGTLLVSSVWADSGRLSDASAAEIMIDVDSPLRTGKAYCVKIAP